MPTSTRCATSCCITSSGPAVLPTSQVSWGCYNKINNRNVLSQLWRLECKIRVLVWSSSGESLFQVVDHWLLLVFSHGTKMRSSLSGIPFLGLMALIPFMKALPHDLINLPMAPTPNTIMLGVRISTYEF